MIPKGSLTSAGFGIFALSGLLLCFHPQPAPAQSQDHAQVRGDFFQAMLAGDTGLALQLLNANTNLARASVYDGKFPLHVAASKGQLDIVEALLKFGAAVDAEGDTWDTGNSHLTALEVAIWYNHSSVVRRLLEAGANPNHAGMWHGGALHVAFTYRRDEMAGWLLDHGANPFLGGGHPNLQKTPLELAITHSDGKLVPRMLDLKSSRPTATQLDRAAFARARAEFLTTNGVSMLVLAAQRGELEAVEALLNAGVSPEGFIPGGHSLFQLFALSFASTTKTPDAATERWTRIRNVLEAHGAKCDIFAATALGDLATVQNLLSKKPELARARDAFEDTPLHWAVRADQLPVTSFWLEAGDSPAAANFAGQTPLHVAVTNGLARQVERLLAANAPTDLRDLKGRTPLDLATELKQTEIIRLLLKSDPAATPPGRGLAISLHEAAQSGNIVALSALANATNIEARNELGLTPLLVAAQHGQLGAAALLIDRGANVNARDPEGNTVLHRILLSQTHWIAGMPSDAWLERQRQDPKKAKFIDALTTKSEYTSAKQVAQSAAFFLACGADATATNKSGQTVLQLATDEQSMLFDEDRNALLQLLSKTGGEGINVRDAGGNTALHRAMHDLNGDNTEALLAAGADVNATNFLGRTPLHSAVEHVGGWGDHQPLSLLLGAKPDVNAQDKAGLTPLHLVGLSDDSFRRQTTEVLLAAGANPTLRDAQGRTPLHLFLSGKWPWSEAGDCVSQLLAAGADPTIADQHGRTLLHCLATLGRQGPMFFLRPPTNFLATMESLVQARDENGDTALHLAAKHGTKDIYDWLLKHGASLDATNHAGETPRQFAIRNQDPFTEFRYKAETDIFQAVRDDKVDSIAALLRADSALLNRTNEAGQSPLRVAAMLGRTNVVEFLDRQGAQWDAPSAAMLGRADVLKNLLAREPAVATKPYLGKSLLHLAAESGVVAAAETLLAARMDVNSRDLAGYTPLGRARIKQHTNMADFLRAHGGTENIFDAVWLDEAAPLLATNAAAALESNNSGLTPAHLAAALGREQTLELMLKHGVSPDAAKFGGEITLLDVAAVCNRTNTTALLLRHRAKVETYNGIGLTPLHLAALCDSAEVAAQLLAHGAKTETPTRPKEEEGNLPPFRRGLPAQCTALHLAALNAQTNVIPVLLKAGASISARNAAGMMPLDMLYSADPGLRHGPPMRMPDYALRNLLYQCAALETPPLPGIFVPPARQRAAVQSLEQAGAKPPQFKNRPSPGLPFWNTPNSAR